MAELEDAFTQHVAAFGSVVGPAPAAWVEVYVGYETLAPIPGAPGTTHAYYRDGVIRAADGPSNAIPALQHELYHAWLEAARGDPDAAHADPGWAAVDASDHAVYSALLAR